MRKRPFHWLFLLIAAIVLSGCDDDDDGGASLGGGGGGDGGGGGGGTVATSISGTAATGAPVANDVVTLVGANGNSLTVFTDIDGNYTADISELERPIMVRVEGTVGTRFAQMHSVLPAEDTTEVLNITPLTEITLGNSLQNAPDAVFGQLIDSQTAPSIDQSTLDASQERLRMKLQSLLDSLGLTVTDFLRTGFEANHTGLDALLDLLEVRVDGTTVTIRNRVDDTEVTDNLADTADDETALEAQAGVSEASEALQGVVATFDELSDLLAGTLPTADDPALTTLFTDNFLLSGYGLTDFLNEDVLVEEMAGARFSNIAITDFERNDSGMIDRVIVEFQVASADGALDPEVDTSEMVFDGQSGKWLIAGDRRLAEVDVGFQTAQFNIVDAATGEVTPEPFTGLVAFVETGPEGQAAGVVSGRLEGPGLPDGGLALNDEGIVDPDTGQAAPNLSLTDQEITNIPDNAAYTVTLLDANGDPVGEPVTTIGGAKPVMNAELSDTLFPTLTSPTPQELADFTTTTLTVAWEPPAEGVIFVDELTVRVVNDQGESEETELDFTPAITTASSQNVDLQVPPGTITQREVILSGRDSKGRIIQVNLNAVTGP